MSKMFEPYQQCETCKNENPNSTQELTLVVVTAVAATLVSKAIKTGFRAYVNSKNGNTET